MPESFLTGKVALVTGGARRVGRAIALRLAQAGMDVAITYQHSAVDADEVVDLIHKMGRRSVAIEVDLQRADAARCVFERFTHSFKSLYALVNNAGSFDPSPIEKVAVDDFDRHMAINARGPLMLIKMFTPLLREHDKPGRIVNFIDIHVMGQPLSGYVAYNASKAALREITMTAAMELSPCITVNAIAPGVVAWASSYSQPQRDAYMTRVPLERPGTPDDAATAVLYLVRDADYCTGQIIKLDGGRLLT